VGALRRPLRGEQDDTAITTECVHGGYLCFKLFQRNTEVLCQIVENTVVLDVGVGEGRGSNSVSLCNINKNELI
jgi:hypothetical protein